mmetsp:Transcript_7291/g.13128  ORF Transcript_7291/g.13128 Transcript_7291/m.13128 type:complete len:298 (-) Transcript_7291:954-1847(-)
MFTEPFPDLGVLPLLLELAPALDVQGRDPLVTHVPVEFQCHPDGLDEILLADLLLLLPIEATVQALQDQSLKPVLGLFRQHKTLAPPGGKAIAHYAGQWSRHCSLSDRERVLALLSRVRVKGAVANEASMQVPVPPFHSFAAGPDLALVAASGRLFLLTYHADTKSSFLFHGHSIVEHRPRLHELLREPVPDHGPVRYLGLLPRGLLGFLVVPVKQILFVVPQLLHHAVVLTQQVALELADEDVRPHVGLDLGGGISPHLAQLFVLDSLSVTSVALLQEQRRVPPVNDHLDRIPSQN